jgi:hypothetical protein
VTKCMILDHNVDDMTWSCHRIRQIPIDCANWRISRLGVFNISTFKAGQPEKCVFTVVSDPWFLMFSTLKEDVEVWRTVINDFRGNEHGSVQSEWVE